MIHHLFAAFLTLLVATAALAAGGEEHHGPSTGELIWQGVNLVLLLVVLLVLARKPIQTFFAQRRGRIVQEMESASEFLKQSEERYARWQRKLVDLDSEVEQIRDTARRRAEEEREQILAEARAAAERIRRDAVAGVDQELRRAQGELRREASELAVELAAGLLRDRVQSDDRDRLMDEFIASVEQSSAPGGSRSGSEA